jgi:hypothetical protein
VRFEGEASEDEQQVYSLGNRWYFFVPLVNVGIWVVVAAARVIAFVLVPGSLRGGGDPRETADVISAVIDVVDWLGGLGWLLLFPFYLVLLSRKRASGWWVLGAFCCGLNLPLYIALLFLPARRYSMPAPVPPEPQVFGREEFARPSAFLLKDSFVCESCDSLLNYGVSECRECGERYEYSYGKPVVDDSPRRRGR